MYTTAQFWQKERKIIRKKDRKILKKPSFVHIAQKIGEIFYKILLKLYLTFFAKTIAILEKIVYNG